MKRKLAFFGVCLLMVTIGLGCWITESSKHLVTTYYQYLPNTGQWIRVEETNILVRQWLFNPAAAPNIRQSRYYALFNHEIPVPHVPLREDVEVHLIPDIQRDAFEVRIWWDSRMVQSLTYPLKEFPRVHF